MKSAKPPALPGAPQPLRPWLRELVEVFRQCSADDRQQLLKVAERRLREKQRRRRVLTR